MSTEMLLFAGGQMVSRLSGGTTPTVVTSSDWASLISSLTAQISVSTVVGVLSTAAAAAIGLVFMWWGARKAVRMLMGAFKKGKLGI